MNTKGIKLTKLEDFTGGGKVICTEVRPEWEYVDNRPTDKAQGTRYEVLFPAQKFARAVIKTPELISPLTQDIIDSHGGAVEIELIGFWASAYVDSKSNMSAFSMRANSIVIVDDPVIF